MTQAIPPRQDPAPTTRAQDLVLRPPDLRTGTTTVQLRTALQARTRPDHVPGWWWKFPSQRQPLKIGSSRLESSFQPCQDAGVYPPSLLGHRRIAELAALRNGQSSLSIEVLTFSATNSSATKARARPSRRNSEVRRSWCCSPCQYLAITQDGSSSIPFRSLATATPGGG